MTRMDISADTVNDMSTYSNDNDLKILITQEKDLTKMVISTSSIINQRTRPGKSRDLLIIILNSTKPPTGHKDSIGMPTLHIGPRSSEEYGNKVKGFSFIVIGDISRSNCTKDTQFRSRGVDSEYFDKFPTKRNFNR